MATVTDKQDEAAPAAHKHVSERESRRVVEAARQTEWTAPSFLKELFNGRLHLELIHPYPQIPQEELDRARGLLTSHLRTAGEQAQARAGGLAAQLFLTDSVRSIEQPIRDLEHITLDEVRSALRDFPPETVTVAALGREPVRL